MVSTLLEGITIPKCQFNTHPRLDGCVCTQAAKKSQKLKEHDMSHEYLLIVSKHIFYPQHVH